MAKKKESSQDKLVNLQAAQLASQVANFAAQLEFQKERFKLLELPEFQQRSQLEIDRLAFEKAEAAYDRAFQEAAITGTYNGQPTLQYLTEVARMTGVLNGEQTIEGKLNDAQIAQINATIMNTQRGMDLEYEKFGVSRQQWDAEHQMKLRDQQAQLTGFIDGLPTFEREQWQANQAQSYLNLLSTLQGPENAFTQLKVLRQTPDALRQMAMSWAGQTSSQTYQSMAAPPPITPQSLAAGAGMGAGVDTSGQVGIMGYPDVAGSTRGGGGTPGTPAYNAQPLGTPAYSVQPPGVQAPIHTYNYQPSVTGGSQVYPPGVPAPAGATQVSTYQPVTQQTQSQMITESDPTAGMGTLVAPGQINAREYNKSTGYEKALGLAAYEAQGWDKGVAQELFNRSLPKYGVGANARGTVQV